MSTVFERLGGEPAIHAAVDLFYDKVLADEGLRPFFATADLGRLRNHQKSFLIQAFGGGPTYQGKALRKAHRRLVEELGLADAHFDAVIGHLGGTLRELGIDEDLIAEAARIAESQRAHILGKALDEEEAGDAVEALPRPEGSPRPQAAL